MKSPKSRFLERKLSVQLHQDTVDKSTFVEALDAAMLDVIDGLQAAKTQEEAAANHFRVEGAKEYMKKLFHLADTKPERAALPDGNLVHKP